MIFSPLDLNFQQSQHVTHRKWNQFPVADSREQQPTATNMTMMILCSWIYCLWTDLNFFFSSNLWMKKIFSFIVQNVFDCWLGCIENFQLTFFVSPVRRFMNRWICKTIWLSISGICWRVESVWSRLATQLYISSYTFLRRVGKSKQLSLVIIKFYDNESSRYCLDGHMMTWSLDSVIMNK